MIPPLVPACHLISHTSRLLTRLSSPSPPHPTPPTPLRYEARQPTEAYKAIEAMRRRGIILSPYLDTRMVEDIYKVRV